ncbi:S-layer homology domain-containing protein [Candidatus Dojkabacteria bacterium]|uniref:S-layer homology domain-containing protein n=1 Tax=Candidatus Dojkabacteria bacterium TaxID=2099670 RepID=A0A955L7R0_9BACT|nr:S-layer homology domain-containing protein [Candidatus Dojkabacteria bacterium]
MNNYSLRSFIVHLIIGGLVFPFFQPFTVIAADEVPEIYLSTSAQVYTQGEAAVVIDSGATLLDTGSDLVTLIISITDFEGDETLAVDTGTGAILASNDGAGTLTLSGTGSVIEYQGLLQSITYENTDTNISTDTTRTISFQVMDEDLNFSAISTLDLSIVPLLSISTVDDDGTRFFVEGGPVIVDTNLLVTSSNGEIESARVEITNVQNSGNEKLSIHSYYYSGKGVTPSGNGTSLLTFSGTASSSTYQEILRNVMYEHTSNSPTYSPDRTVTMTVNDGITESEVSISTIGIESETYTAEVEIDDSTLTPGEDIDIEVVDGDGSTHSKIKDEVYVEVKNGSEEERVKLTETGVNTGVFRATLSAYDDEDCEDHDDYDHDDNGKLCTDKGDTIKVTYEDPVDEDGDEAEITATKVVAGSSSSSSTTTTTVKKEEEECTSSSAFPDTCDHSLAEYIEDLFDDGIVGGYADGEFKADNDVTRGQMATFVRRAFDLTSDTPGNCFSDVNETHTHYEDIILLCSLGITKGYADGTYRPDDPVKRDEVTKFVSLAMEKNGVIITDFDDHSFPDTPMENPFHEYISFLSTAEKDGIRVINGYKDGNFGPKDTITRGQMAKVISVSRAFVGM